MMSITYWCLPSSARRPFLHIYTLLPEHRIYFVCIGSPQQGEGGLLDIVNRWVT